MPNYSYQCENGHEWDSVKPMAMRDRAFCPQCGMPGARNWRRELLNRRIYKGVWPVLSDAAGVHPDQIPEAKARAAARGVKIDFTSDGRAIFESPRQRREYCRLRGLRDMNGGYSDP